MGGAYVVALVVGAVRLWGLALVSGEWRVGVVFVYLCCFGLFVLVVELLADGVWILRGFVFWVMGWGCIDVVHIVVVCGDDVVWLLVDAHIGLMVGVECLLLVAVDVLVMVVLHLRDHLVLVDRVTVVELLRDWLVCDALGLCTNGFLVLGVVGWVCALLGRLLFDGEVVVV